MFYKAENEAFDSCVSGFSLLIYHCVLFPVL